jgi:hypothetical protein
MKLLLKKVRDYNRAYPKLLFSLSFLFMTLMIGFLFLQLHRFKEKAVTINQFQTLFKDSAYLQQADKIVQAHRVEPANYIQSTLEPLKLLTHLEHRHTHSLNPSLPIDLNPHENCLKHQFFKKNSKGISWTAINLLKPALVDEEDLKQLFSLIEHRVIFPFKPQEAHPYLFFTHFELTKRQLSSFEKVFQISYSLESVTL